MIYILFLLCVLYVTNGGHAIGSILRKPYTACSKWTHKWFTSNYNTLFIFFVKNLIYIGLRVRSEFNSSHRRHFLHLNSPYNQIYNSAITKIHNIFYWRSNTLIEQLFLGLFVVYDVWCISELNKDEKYLYFIDFN